MGDAIEIAIVRIMPLMDFFINYVTKILTALAAQVGVDLDELYGQQTTATE